MRHHTHLVGTAESSELGLLAFVCPNTIALADDIIVF